MRDRDKTKSGEWTRDRLKMKKTQEGKAEERERERELRKPGPQGKDTESGGVCVYFAHSLVEGRTGGGKRGRRGGGGIVTRELKVLLRSSLSPSNLHWS